MKHLILLIFLTKILFSQNLILDDLLKKYEDSESLYKQTKKESAGYLIVYSRDDLEKMQAFHLRDVLKTIRMYNIQVNGTAAIGILNSGAGKTSIAPIKIYIDDFEISTVAQRNALDMYGDMDIYFVDHIEVYQGGTSISFGNELGSMVIRLYSKDPSRENSISSQLSIDNKSGGNLRAVGAGKTGEYKYLFYANAEDANYNTYERNNQELSRDAKRYQAHFKISKDDDFAVEADTIINKTDIFNGVGTAPTNGKTTKTFAYINATKYFADNLEVSFSASQEIKEATNTDANGIRLADGTFSNYIDVSVYANTYKSSIKKKITDNNNELLVGAEIQRKVYSVKKYEGLSTSSPLSPNELNIFMIYFEELYNLNENNLITLSAKLDRYENSINKDSNEYSLRLGHIAILNETWKSKIFAIRRYVYPSALQSSFSPPIYNPNPNLDATNIDMISAEVEYKTNSNRLVFGGAYKKVDNAMILDGVQKMYINKNSSVDIHRYYLRAQHRFNLENKIVLEGFKVFVDNYATPDAGGLLQIFNTIGKFDIYNELLYRNSVTVDYGMGDVKTDTSYDYTLSVSYEIDKNVKLKLKGENLLDKAQVTQIDPSGSLEVPAIQRRAILTMEYTF